MHYLSVPYTADFAFNAVAATVSTGLAPFRFRKIENRQWSCTMHSLTDQDSSSFEKAIELLIRPRIPSIQ